MARLEEGKLGKIVKDVLEFTQGGFDFFRYTVYSFPFGLTHEESSAYKNRYKSSSFYSAGVKTVMMGAPIVILSLLVLNRYKE